MLTRKNPGNAAWTKVALAMALVGSFAVLGETGASATTSVTLYVNSSDSGSSCLDNSANACPMLQDAINVGEALTTTDVTIDVAAGTYNESDTINTLPSSDSLTIQGASAVSTTVTGTTNEAAFTIGAGGPVTINDLTISGTVMGVDSISNPNGNGYGGGIYNASADLTVNYSVFSGCNVYGAATTSSPGGSAYGGAIYDASGDLILSGDTFSNDTAWGGGGNGPYPGGLAAGGAVYVAGGTLFAEFDTFHQDGAYGGLGGVLTNGYAGGESWGGAVFSNSTSTSFNISTFSNDVADGGLGRNGAGGTGGAGGNAYGGALYVPSSVTGSSAIELTKDTLVSDDANGGFGGNGTLIGGSGSAFGGSFYDGATSSTTTTLTDDTLNLDATNAHGAADSYGGAIDNTSSTTTALNVTLASNSVLGGGDDQGAGVVTGGTFTFENSILDQSLSCYNLGGTFVDGSYNVESDNSCGFGGSDLINNASIALASLAANNSTGPDTMAIDNTSSAYEEVPAAKCTYPYDERGGIGARPGITGANCDAGAFEFQGYTVTYEPNSGSGGPIDSNNYGPGETVEVLFSSLPTLSGYGFGGWCTVQEAVDTPCSGTVFPHADFPVTEFTMASSNVTLYALWDTPTTLYVNASEGGSTCADATTNACPTIQDAINKAESLSNSAVTIEVAAGTYDEDDLIYFASNDANNDTINIVGAGPGSTFVDDSLGPDLTIDNGLVSVSNLTIENGSHLGSDGGGIADYGALIANNDTFSSNDAEFGGGIFDDGTLIATDDTFNANQAQYAGGIYVAFEGYLISANDTFFDNQASTEGGAIYSDSDATAASATFGTFYEASTSISNDTFYNDTATGGGDALGNQGAPTVISNSILDESDSCAGSFSYGPDGGYNVETDDTCLPGLTDLESNTTINLATSLAVNGSTGPETLAIDPTSSAYQEVPSGECFLNTDERGDPRPGSGSSCDAGAYEYQAPPTIIAPATPATTTTTSTPTDTVTFASDGGSFVSSLSGANGSSVTLPAAPLYAHHVFTGWFTQPTGGTLAGQAGASYTLSGSFTLFAQWKVAAARPPRLVTLGTVHTFTLGSSFLSTTLKSQVAAFASVIRARHYTSVNLEGEALGPVNLTNQRLALARAVSVEVYLKSLGLTSVRYVLSARVTGSTAASLVVVVASSSK
jgi:predicted outer membrane repeat protein